MNKHQSGFTLIEWLIGLSIGLFMLTFTSRLYISLYKTGVFIRNNVEVDNNARIALNWLAYDIRMAGFIGCANLEEIPFFEEQNLLTHSLLGWHQGNTQGLPPPTQKSIKASDILYLHYADPVRIPIIAAQNNKVQFAQRSNFSPDTVLMLSDCRHAELLQLNKVRLKHVYQTDAEVSPFYRLVYYVGQTNRKNSYQQPIYALYRQDLHAKAHPTELVENVEKLELYYGIPNKGLLQYVPAHQVRDWQQVRSITMILHFSDPYSARSTEASRSLSKRTHSQTVMIRARTNPYLT
jgi:type IV pilus assembly protein PilW